MDTAVSSVRSADEARALFAQLEQREVGGIHVLVSQDRAFVHLVVVFSN